MQATRRSRQTSRPLSSRIYGVPYLKNRMMKLKHIKACHNALAARSRIEPYGRMAAGEFRTFSIYSSDRHKIRICICHQSSIPTAQSMTISDNLWRPQADHEKPQLNLNAPLYWTARSIERLADQRLHHAPQHEWRMDRSAQGHSKAFITSEMSSIRVMTLNIGEPASEGKSCENVGANLRS